MTDWELLRQYVEHDDEHAFLRLVERHQDFVFASAKRQTGDASTAEDVAQGVFLLLARKAARISSGVVLTSWLFRATRFSALAALRSRRRRETHERESAMLRPDNAEPGWMQLAPHLDAAMDRLSETDRSAILLRYFRRQSLREVGEALGIGEEAARKRVDRAAGKLRETLLRSGVTLSMAAILTLITANRSEAAPAGFGERISAALRDSSIAPGSQLANEAARRWATRSLLPWAVVCLLLLLTSAVVFKNRTTSKTEPPLAAVDTNITAETIITPASEPAPIHHRMLVRVVDDADGRPLTNAVVRYDFRNSSASHYTDARGESVVPFPESVSAYFEFEVWAPGFIAKYVEWRWSEWDSLPSQYTARIRRGVLLRGVVVDESDQPVAGATITPTWGTGYDSSRESERVRIGAHTAISDDGGRWELLMVPGPSTDPDRYELHARHINYANATVELNPGMFPLTNSMKLVLSNGFVFQGVVLTTEGVPIVGAVVEASVRPGYKQTTTDRQGRFMLPHLPSSDNSTYGWLGFKAKAEGYQPWQKSINTKSNMEDVVITLQPLPNLEDAPLRGRIAYDDGRPIPATIFPSSAPYDPATAIKSDYDGFFAAAVAPPGTRSYTVWLSGHDPLHVELTADGTEQKIVVARPDILRIEGTVVDEMSGRPVPEFDVLMIAGNNPDEIDSTSSQLLASGRNGKFALRCRPASADGKEPHLLFKAKGYRKEMVAISTNANPMVVKLGLDPIRALKVKILQPDGNPAVGAQGGFSFSRKAPINKDGEFTPIPSAKTPAVIYTADFEGVLTTPPPDPTLLQLTVAHPSGFGKMLTKVRLKDSLQLSSWASVRGVLNIGGKPAAGVLLGLTCSPYHYPYNAETTTDTEGRFEFNRVPDGKFTVARRYISGQEYPGSNLKTFDTAAGEELVLVLGESGVRVTGRLTEQSSSNRFVPETDRIVLRLPGQTDKEPRTFGIPLNPDGSFTFDDVPPGEYILDAMRIRNEYDPMEFLLTKNVVVPENTTDLNLGNLPVHKP